MTKRTIITCAVTGNLTRPDQHPGLPITPPQIAKAALDAAEAGAAIVHLHVRDPKTGKGSMDLALYEELVGLIRAENRRVIINLTTGEGGRFVPSIDEPRMAAEGSTLCRPEKRVAHVERLRPEICTLDFNTMWSGQAAVINSPRNVQIMAERIYAAGVKPEIELFDTGDLHMAKHFLEQGILKGMYLFRDSGVGQGNGKGKKAKAPCVQLLGSGTILREVIAAAELLEKDFGVAADIWSCPSFSELRRDGFDAERWNRLHPEAEQRLPYVTQLLQGRSGPAVAATDYVREYADQIRAFLPDGMRYTVLGTDGFGRSDTRANLRRHFEVDRYYIAQAAIDALAKDGKMNAKDVSRAIKEYKLDQDKPNPLTV